MMRKGSASLSPFDEFADRIPAPAKAKVDELTKRILSGELIVKTNDTQPKSTF